MTKSSFLAGTKMTAKTIILATILADTKMTGKQSIFVTFWQILK